MLTQQQLDVISYEDVKDITSEEYFSEDEYASIMFNTKYSIKYDEEGNVVTDSDGPYAYCETPADVFYRVASSLAAIESTKDLKEKYTNDWFALMWLGWFRPGGSVLSGVSSPVKKSLLNCATLPLKGDSLEDIAKCDYDIMKCAAFRQGLGFDASVLRPRGAKVNNAAEESTGVMPWVEKLVDNGGYVGQKGREPALLVSLKDRHPDIFEFITAKLEQGKIEKANISVQISDAFMQAVKDDADWELYFDFEDNKYERISKTIKAKELFDLITSTACTSAEPGVQYLDKLRAGYMVHQIYLDTGDERFKGVSTNACSEKFLCPYNVCNLLSLNNVMFSTNKEEYREELEFIVPYVVRLSDNVVAYELLKDLSPLNEQKWVLDQTRELGLGITNIHGWLLKQDVAYDSAEAILVVEDFMKYYAYNAFRYSIELGKEKGSAPAFSRVSSVDAFKGSSYFSNIINEFYGGDTSSITHMRNLAHMSVAPTGSVSSTFPTPCFSYGVEPVTGSYWWRRTRAIDKGTYTHYFIIPKQVQDYVLSKLDKDSTDYASLALFPGSLQDESGEIGLGLGAIIDSNLPKGFFKPAHYIDYKQKIKLMGAMYKWVDAAISCTYNLPSTATKEDVATIYMEAFNEGVRAVSVYVDGSRKGVLIFDDPITNAAKTKDKNIALCDELDRPMGIMPNCAPKRLEELQCDIFHTSIKGELWTVLVGLLDDKPYEIFAGNSEDLYLPKACREGMIRKQGKGKYELEVMIRKSPVVYRDLASVLMNDDEKALTRILSLNLRHGVLPRYIVEQLKKSNGNITAFSTAISRVLSKYIGTYDLSADDNTCPQCGEHSLVFEEGCIKCAMPECLYSRCS